MLPTPTKRTTRASASMRATASAAPLVGARARCIASTSATQSWSGLSAKTRVAISAACAATARGPNRRRQAGWRSTVMRGRPGSPQTVSWGQGSMTTPICGPESKLRRQKKQAITAVPRPGRERPKSGRRCARWRRAGSRAAYGREAVGEAASDIRHARPGVEPEQLDPEPPAASRGRAATIRRRRASRDWWRSRWRRGRCVRRHPRRGRSRAAPVTAGGFRRPGWVGNRTDHAHAKVSNARA